MPVNNNDNNANKLHVPSDLNSAKHGNYDAHAARVPSNHCNGHDTHYVSSAPHNRFTSELANENAKRNHVSSNLYANQNAAKRNDR